MVGFGSFGRRAAWAVAVCAGMVAGLGAGLLGEKAEAQQPGRADPALFMSQVSVWAQRAYDIGYLCDRAHLFQVDAVFTNAARMEDYGEGACEATYRAGLLVAFGGAPFQRYRDDSELAAARAALEAQLGSNGLGFRYAGAAADLAAFDRAAAKFDARASVYLAVRARARAHALDRGYIEIAASADPSDPFAPLEVTVRVIDPDRLVADAELGALMAETAAALAALEDPSQRAAMLALEICVRFAQELGETCEAIAYG